ncbi:hypothetical protein ACF1BP_36740 [Streptomyces sp. NPDC014735]|uniref:hypothetical protein n=1 Tax=unclassified Streptomyces TaxID=2593676 RepID=UPI00093B7044|nr:hypothetical protein [Streptomyces sp. CB01580]
MPEQIDAAAALKGVARIEATARARSRWYVRYLWMFAGWQLIVVPAVLLWHGMVGALVSACANAVVVMGLSLFTVRQPVMPRGYARVHLRVIGAWTAAYAVALVLGFLVFADSVAFAAAAALVCALPAAATAWREGRAA